MAKNVLVVVPESQVRSIGSYIPPNRGDRFVVLSGIKVFPDTDSGMDAARKYADALERDVYWECSIERAPMHSSTKR